MARGLDKPRVRMNTDLNGETQIRAGHERLLHHCVGEGFRGDSHEGVGGGVTHRVPFIIKRFAQCRQSRACISAELAERSYNIRCGAGSWEGFIKCRHYKRWLQMQYAKGSCSSLNEREVDVVQALDEGWNRRRGVCSCAKYPKGGGATGACACVRKHSYQRRDGFRAEVRQGEGCATIRNGTGFFVHDPGEALDGWFSVLAECGEPPSRLFCSDAFAILDRERLAIVLYLELVNGGSELGFGAKFIVAYPSEQPGRARRLVSGGGPSGPGAVRCGRAVPTAPRLLD